MLPLKIVSLLPSATEIIHLLDLTEYQVGRSHECDYPDGIGVLPACTAPKFNPEGTSAEIHDRVTTLLQSALSVYQVKTDILQTLKPTHILTQAQCEVCAVSLADVEVAVESITGISPQILSLQPNSLEQVWGDIRRIAQELLGSVEPAEAAIAPLKNRVETCRTLTQDALHKPSVVCIEWPEPLMAAGNWVPELVRLAGGMPMLSKEGQHSPWITWNDLVKADPEVIILMPCGYDIEQTIQESRPLLDHSFWPLLRAVKTGRVYAVDGNQYFNRPGPRLADSVEILAEMLHPDIVPSRYQNQAWQTVVEMRQPSRLMYRV
ncbi:cobalamin-binding protein [Oscillatoria sp. CS-180]|uniref:cobalamin-binding protein n=1 Tax=Oscillatoria sp. CS-180 TaxID=3021720 RepID=UPI00232C1CEE|nr:cobalamin-binding protein [Oscillatoria sp. CS-180]MDB9527085.1 cobalamin-binding protein [Oscillatoria sp. CS-180]